MECTSFAYTMRRPTYYYDKNPVVSGYRLVLLDSGVPIIIKLEACDKSSHLNCTPSPVSLMKTINNHFNWTVAVAPVVDS